EKTKDRSTKQKLGRMLTKLDIKPIKLTDQSYVYRKSCVDLKVKFDDNKWIDDENDVVNEEKDLESQAIKYCEPIIQSNLFIYHDIKKENNDLKQQVALLQEQIKQLTVTKKVIRKVIKEEVK